MKNFLKKSILLVLGLIVTGSVFATQDWKPFGQLYLYMKGTLYTSNGLSSGSRIMGINESGDNLIKTYVPLQDGSGNSYLTGGALSGYLTGDKNRTLSGSDIYNTNTGIVNLGNSTTTINYTGIKLVISGGAYFDMGNSLVGLFAIKGFGINDIGVGGFVQGTNAIGVYGQTDVGTAGYFEAIGTGTALKVDGTTTINGNLGVSGNITATQYCIGYQCYSKLSTPLAGRITVSKYSQFTGVKQAFDWINLSGTTQSREVLIDAGTRDIKDTITIAAAYPISVRGLGLETTILQASGGLSNKPMFKIYSPTEFSSFGMKATTLASYGTLANEDGMQFLTQGNYHQVSNVLLDGFNKGIYMNRDGELRLFNSIVSNSIAYGSFISGSNYRAANCDFTNNKVTNYLYAGSGYFFTVEHNKYVINSGQIAVEYNPALYTNYRNISIFNENFEIATSGTVLSGFDFTTSRDANIEIYGSIGIEDYRPHGKYNIVGGTTSTTYTQNIRAKLAYTLTNKYSKKRSMTNTGRLTFLPSHPKSAMIWVSAAVTTSTQPAPLKISIVKNGDTGTLLGTMTIYLDQNARAFNYSQNIYLDEIKQGDFYELYINPGANNEDVILQDMNRLVDSR